MLPEDEFKEYDDESSDIAVLVVAVAVLVVLVDDEDAATGFMLDFVLVRTPTNVFAVIMEAGFGKIVDAVCCCCCCCCCDWDIVVL